MYIALKAVVITLAAGGAYYCDRKGYHAGAMLCIIVGVAFLLT